MADMFQIITDMLRLCKVKENEKAIVLTPHRYDPYYINFYLAALNNVGADYLHVIIPPQRKKISYKDYDSKQLVLSQFDADVLKTADVIIGVRKILRPEFPWISMYQPQFKEIQEKGTRWLDVMLSRPEMNLSRLFPTESLVKRSIAGAEMISKAKTIRIVSEAGTDLTMDNNVGSGHAQYGIADGAQVLGKKHTWDNFGFGIVSCWPKVESANGTLVMDAGDYILKMSRVVTDPVKCTFEDGYITEIEGGFSAKLFKKWLDKWGDPNSYAVAHIGWGTHIEGAVWTDNVYFTVADAESYPGVMQVAVGSGSYRESISHCDIECLSCDFYLDDELIVKKGVIIHPGCK